MLHIHSTETFGSVDGPGIRYVIFLQGCQMRCQYCHNPDSWKTGVGETVSVDDLIDKAARYRTYWGDKGGITVSGGEALLQMGALTQLFRKAHERGINTCLDTSAQPFTRREPWFGKFEELMRYTDTVLLDIKHIRPEGHKQLTGYDNKTSSTAHATYPTFGNRYGSATSSCLVSRTTTPCCRNCATSSTRWTTSSGSMCCPIIRWEFSNMRN